MFESLEQRRYFVLPISGSVIDLDDTPDVAFVTAGNDVIEVILSGGNIQVRNGAGAVLDQRSAAGVTGISINGQAGNDFIRIGRADGTLMPTVPVTIRGGAGNDTIIGGNSGDQLFGDGENDRLDGRAGGDRMEGGAGFDTADYGSRTRSINVSLANSGTANDGTTAGGNGSPADYNDNGSDNLVDMEAVIGSSNADFMTGSSAANWFDGGGGNDTIFGGAGIDSITGGVNTDLAYGEADSDFFFFQDSTGDLFLGGAGTTSAQYDAALDLPAPALPAAASESLQAAMFAEFAEEEPPNLIPDDSFGDNGQVAAPIEVDLGDEFIVNIIVEINDVAIQTVEGEDKIVVVGTAGIPEGDTDVLVARFNADGSLDTTFGEEENGYVLIDFSGFTESPHDDRGASVAIGSGGKIIVAGTSEYFVGDSIDLDVSEYIAMRLNQDGTLDSDFGSGGQYLGTGDGEFTFDSASRIVTQFVNDEEYYLITGTLEPQPTFLTFSEDITTADWGTIRLTNDGSLDAGEGGFAGGSGLLITSFIDAEFETDEYATGLAVDPVLGNIWLSGTQFRNTGSGFAVAGYTADGEPIDGAVSFYDFTNFPGVFEASAADSVIFGDRLVVVGTAYEGDAPSRAAMASFSIAADDAGTRVGSSTLGGDDSMWWSAVAFDETTGTGVVAGNVEDDYQMFRFELVENNPLVVGNGAVIDFAPGLDKEFTDDVLTGIAIGSDGSVVLAGDIDDPLLGLAKLVQEETEEPPFVDVDLDGQTVQAMSFLIGGDPDSPVPTYLTERLRSLRPDGTVELSGTEFDDVITISEADGIVTVTINGEQFQYTRSQVTSVVINGLGGNDSIRAIGCPDVPLVVDGGKGNDTVVGGKADDFIRGSSGNDSLDGGCGGNDKVFGDSDKDTVRGGDGNDRVYGGEGDDLVEGGVGHDNVDGEAGKDTVKGEAGNDTASGGAGDDSVEGGDGNDTVHGDSGKDTVKGGANDDLMFGDSGNDSMYGDGGRDILIGGLDSDRLDGGADDDILNGGITSYDNNLVALTAIAAEWSRADANYNTRVNNIVNGGGLNGSFKFNASTVVSAPIPADTLTGGLGTDLFYLALLGFGDRATDRISAERIVYVPWW